MMKQIMNNRIKNVFGVTALLLVFVAMSSADAQSPPPPVAQSAVANSVQLPTLPPDMDPNSPFGQVIRMTQAGAAENVVLAHITGSSMSFDLSAADVTYLNDLGTPVEIQAAMIQRNHELGGGAAAQPSQPTPSVQTQEPQDVTEDYFYGALEPYGTWINMPGYGLCWQPCAATYNSNWTPYGTLGQWIYTDCGWYWLSGYSWGWCAFHYGRWFHDAQRGWCWWPSSTWAPSWVFWRYGGNYCGWAPLPPHCYYSQENGLMYHGASITSGYDFGIGANLFVFVPMANLCDANAERFRLSTAEAGQVFARSDVLNGINSNDRIIVNDGIPVSRIAKFTGGEVRSFAIRPVESVAVPGARGEQILSDGETLAINRPYFNRDAPSGLRQGVWPIAAQQQPVPHQPPTIIVNQIPYSYPSPDYQNNNSVIYVDSASQNGPPVPTVTTEGPQDYGAGAGGTGAAGQSYWSVSADAPAPVDTSSLYMSPRQQSHEHLRHKVSQSADHREFNPPSEGSSPGQHQDAHADAPDQKKIDVQLISGPPPRTVTSSPSHSSAPNAPAHTESGPPSPSDGHHGR
jgi:hypothetical protein